MMWNNYNQQNYPFVNNYPYNANYNYNGSMTPAAAGTVRIQLAQNNVLDLSSFSEATGAAAQITDLSFTTLVQVRDNNTCCCNTAPTTLQLINAGEAGTFSIVRVTVTKLC